MYTTVHVSRNSVCVWFFVFFFGFFWAYFEVQDGELCLFTFPELYRKASRKFQSHSGKGREEQGSIQHGSDTGQRCVRCLMVLQAWDIRHLTLEHAGLSEPFPLLQAPSSTDVNILVKNIAKLLCQTFLGLFSLITTGLRCEQLHVSVLNIHLTIGEIKLQL